MNREEILLRNYQKVIASLHLSAKFSGRNPEDITLMAVTKYAPDEDVLFFLQQGLIKHIGESRVQQAELRWNNPLFAKYNTVKHFIGHLQKNKAAKAAKLFDFIDSLDHIHTAQALEEHVPPGKILRVLVQVKLTNRDTQSGLTLEDARQLVQALKTFEHLKVCGYMGIAPQGASEPELRAIFSGLKKVFEEDFPPSAERYLSLGMSEDFKIAVEEGSNLPRIGSLLFAKNLEEV